MTVRTTGIYDKWFKKLRDIIAKAAIIRRIELIESQSYFGDSKQVGDGVFELRIHYGGGYRVYYTVRRKEIVILLCGGDKDSQQRDITQAKELAKEV